MMKTKPLTRCGKVTKLAKTCTTNEKHETTDDDGNALPDSPLPEEGKDV